MLVGFLALVLLIANWRVSIALFFCLMLDFVGMVISTVPPNFFVNQALGHALLGALLGALISATRGRDRDIRRVPYLVAFSMFSLTLSWCSGVEKVLGLWWLYLDRVVVFPAAMLAVVVILDRYKMRLNHPRQTNTPKP